VFLLASLGAAFAFPDLVGASANPFFPVHTLLLSWLNCLCPISFQEVCSIGAWLGGSAIGNAALPPVLSFNQPETSHEGQSEPSRDRRQEISCQ
jgi:hypothetical protein